MSSSIYTIKQYEVVTQLRLGLTICLSLRVYNCFKRNTMTGGFDALCIIKAVLRISYLVLLF
jgi:hypothetical protein